MKDTQEVKTQLQKNYEFVIFYRASCPHCQRFAPILNQFSNQNGFLVESVATDGIISAYYPHGIKMTPELKEAFFGRSSDTAVPALFLLNRQNGHVYPISQGELSWEELNTRMEELMPKIDVNEKNEKNERSKKSEEGFVNE